MEVGHKLVLAILFFVFLVFYVLGGFSFRFRNSSDRSTANVVALILGTADLVYIFSAIWQLR